MAIVLDENAEHEPRWIELPKGAALLCAPATSALLSAAEAMADAVVIELVASHEVVTRVGGRIVGAPDLSSAEAIAGVRHTMVLVSLMELAARDWRRVLDADRKPLPFRPSLLAMLLSDPTVCRAIERNYLRPLHEVVDEKNALGPSRNGISGRAAAGRTAKVAKRRAPSARPPARKSARTTSTRQ